MITGPSGNVVPVMLVEKRFKAEYDAKAKKILGENYDDQYEVTADMVEEAIDTNGNIIEGKIPTTAELIFRLLTRSFNLRQFDKNVDAEAADELLSLIINNGEDTLPDSEYTHVEFYKRKTLWFD